MNIIAFDLGGSSGKIFLGEYAEKKLRINLLHHFDHSAVSLGSHLFWDFLRIYQELCYGISAAVNATNDDITSLGIDSYCNDFALITPTGELLTQMHCYRDSRTMELKEQIYDVMDPKQLYFINGNQNAPFNTLMQLAAMNLQDENYLLQSNKLLFLPDLLIYYLTGKMQTEYTLASVSQMFDSNIRDWSSKILNHYGIPQRLFSEIVYPGTVTSYTDSFTNQKLHTKGFAVTTVCEHDTASAFLAAADNPGCAIISCGTWALVGCETSVPVIQEYGYRYNIANEGGFRGHHRILRNVMGTWLIQEIRAELCSPKRQYSYSDMEQDAAAAEPFRYLIDVDDEIFYSPGNMISKIQSYCQKYYNSYPDTSGALIRCIYESLALKYRWNLEKLHTLTNIDFHVVNILGGGSQSTLMCQFTADATGLPVIAGPVEATALGNMIVQLIALKQISGISEGRQLIRSSVKTTEYLPQNTYIWNKQYLRFKNQIVSIAERRSL